MNSASITGTIASEIKGINGISPNAFCRFDLTVDDRTFDCLIVGSKTHKFIYDVEKGMEVTIEALINNQMQLMVFCYETHSRSNYFGKLFDSKGQILPQDKASY